jgi:hypothetical protein
LIVFERPFAASDRRLFPEEERFNFATSAGLAIGGGTTGVGAGIDGIAGAEKMHIINGPRSRP